MKQQCEGCAFRPGAQPGNQQPYNELRGEICALGGIPFYCHTGFDWQRLGRAEERPPTGAELRASGTCAGWRARVRELNTTGHYRKGGKVRRWIALYAYQLVDQFVHAKPGHEKRRLHWRLREAIAFLAKRKWRLAQ